MNVPNDSMECPRCGKMVVPQYFQDSGELQDGPLDAEYYCECGESWVR